MAKALSLQLEGDTGPVGTCSKMSQRLSEPAHCFSMFLPLTPENVLGIAAVKTHFAAAIFNGGSD